MKTIAIINIGPIGDVVNTSHICQKLKDKYPEAEIIYVANSISVDVAKCMPGVSKVYEFERYTENAALKMFKLAFEIRKNHKVTLAVVLTDNYRSSIFSCLIGARMRIGRDFDGSGFFLTHKIPLLEEERQEKVHIKEHYNRVLRPLGLHEIENKSTFVFSEEDKIDTEKLLKENGWNGEELIGFNPCTGRVFKDLDPLNATKFLSKIKNNNNKIVIVGTESGHEFAKKIAENGFCDFIDLTNKTSIPQIGALISLFTKFVSTDSAPMHIGFNLNVPTLAIFVQPNFQKWGPSDFIINELAVEYGCMTTEMLLEKYYELCNKNNLSA